MHWIRTGEAPPTAPDNASITAGWARLFCAAEAGHADNVQQLLAAGADHHTPMPGTGETVLHVAAEHGHADIVAVLLSALADVDAVDYLGVTALHLAAQHGHSTVVQELLKAGASVGISTSTGATPLFLAVGSRCTGAVTQLLQAGASPTAAAVQGVSALELALQQGSEDLINTMVQHTACPQETSALVHTVWNWHIRNGSTNNSSSSSGTAKLPAQPSTTDDIDLMEAIRRQARLASQLQDPSRRQSCSIILGGTPGATVREILSSKQTPLLAAPKGSNKRHTQLAAARRVFEQKGGRHMGGAALLLTPTPAQALATPTIEAWRA